MAAPTHDHVARAIACFEQSDDPVFLHRMLVEIAPRARKVVARYVRRGGEDAIPPPAHIPAADPGDALSPGEAETIVAQLEDFSLLQAVARAIGQRVEALEIVASAAFPEGTVVRVPKTVAFPPSDPFVQGTVTATGTTLHVALVSGGAWSGPPSLAQPVDGQPGDR